MPCSSANCSPDPYHDGIVHRNKISEQINSLQESVDHLRLRVEATLAQNKQHVAGQEERDATPSIAEPPSHRRPPALQYQHKWGKIVELNVGGQYFTTALDTLTQQPGSMLAAMFSGTHSITVDAAGRAFIDRDSKLFRHVLAFLREGADWHPPSDPALWARLQREFVFYNLTTGFEEPAEGSMDAAKHLADEEAEAARGPVGPSQAVYAMGGQAPGTFHRLGYETNTWTPLPGPPTNFCTFMAAAALGGRMYICGGRSTGRELCSNLECYNPAEQTWQRLPGMLAALGFHAAAGCRGSLYIAGGSGQQDYLPSVWRYSPVTATWTEVAAMGQGRDGLAAAELQGVVYVVGGKGSNTQFLNTVERYDPREGMWQLVANMGVGREGHAAAAWMGRLWVVGGSGAAGLLADVESYDPRADAWVQERPLAAPKFGHSAVVVSGQLLVLGGSSGREELRDVELVSPPADAALVPQPLWRATGGLPAAMDRGRFWGVAVGLEL